MASIATLVSGIEAHFGTSTIHALYQFGVHELPAVRAHEVHLLLVLSDAVATPLPLQAKLSKQIASIQIFKVSELASASDVFPLEFMDLKWGRTLLLGNDVLQDIVIQGANIRHEAEFYTRSLVLKLRSAIITNPTDVPGIIAYGVSDVIRGVRGLLNQNEAGRVRTPEAVVDRMSVWIKHPLSELKKAVTTSNIRQIDPSKFLEEVTLVAQNIDQL